MERRECIFRGALGSVVTRWFALGVDARRCAAAQSPTLLSVTQQSRHPSATFSAPGADSPPFTSLPALTAPPTGASFKKTFGIWTPSQLTRFKLGHGRTSRSSTLGCIYAMMRADDFDCPGTPSCIAGFSNILTLKVPKPSHTYRGSVQVFHYSHLASLTLRVTRLGESLPYKVCWKLKSKRRRCLSGKVQGYSWNSSADDTLDVRLRGMKQKTTFAWYVGGRKVASKTANTTPR
jgi:hypothetical protein